MPDRSQQAEPVESKPTDVCQRKGCGLPRKQIVHRVCDAVACVVDHHEFVPAERVGKPSVREAARRAGIELTEPHGAQDAIDMVTGKRLGLEAPQPEAPPPIRTRCERCKREEPFEEEWDTLAEGARPDLCWGDPIDCSNAQKPEPPPPPDALRAKSWFDDLDAAKEVAELSGGLARGRSLELIEELRQLRAALEAREREIAQAERDVRMYRDMDKTWKATANEVIDQLQRERDVLAAKAEEQARTIEFTTKANLELAADMARAVAAERERADAAEALLARCAEWFAGFPHQGTASDFDRATAANLYAALIGACAKAEKGEDRA